MKINLTCPECKYTWTYGFWQWMFKAPFHHFNFHHMRDYRHTKCPKCGRKSWIGKNTQI